jgi:hypothetical protein
VKLGSNQHLTSTCLQNAKCKNAKIKNRWFGER